MNKRIALSSVAAREGALSIHQVRGMKLKVGGKRSAEKSLDKVTEVGVRFTPTFIRHAGPADDKNGLFGIG